MHAQLYRTLAQAQTRRDLGVWRLFDIVRDQCRARVRGQQRQRPVEQCRQFTPYGAKQHPQSESAGNVHR
jgi:hypothetical protein